MDPNELLDKAPTISVEEAAIVLGIGRSAAYEAVKRGQLPALRLGRKLKVSTAALRALLAEGSQS